MEEEMEDKLKYIRSLFPKWERPTPIPCKFVTCLELFSPGYNAG